MTVIRSKPSLRETLVRHEAKPAAKREESKNDKQLPSVSIQDILALAEKKHAAQ